MIQREKVIKTMKDNNGFATLGFLNQNVDISDWKTKTPFASIRRIVQDVNYFFKIKLGLWALKTYKHKLLFDVFPNIKISENQKKELDYTYFQGLLIEIGNLKGFETFVPYQDKNKKYLGLPLLNYTNIDKFYEFGYENIIRRAITIDVSWFNERKMPNSFFEVEHSTNIQNSLLKFVNLQDFNVNFFIVADGTRKKEFDDKINNFNAFKIIKKNSIYGLWTLI